MMTNETIFFGVDPDLHNPVIAAVNAAGICTGVLVIERKGKTEREAVVELIAELRETWGTSVWAAGIGYVTDTDYVAIEAQELYNVGLEKTKNPRDILFLGHVAGALIAIFAETVRRDHIFFPAPIQWKGNVPKHVHHVRILDKLGWTAEAKVQTNMTIYVPHETSPNFPASAKGLHYKLWYHILDAIGLAQHAREKVMKKEQMNNALARAREQR